MTVVHEVVSLTVLCTSTPNKVAMCGKKESVSALPAHVERSQRTRRGAHFEKISSILEMFSGLAML
jgi:hypothetical protein